MKIKDACTVLGVEYSSTYLIDVIGDIQDLIEVESYSLENETITFSNEETER